MIWLSANMETITASNFLCALVIMNVLDLADLDITNADEPVAARLCVSTVSVPQGRSNLFVTPSALASGSTGGRSYIGG